MALALHAVTFDCSDPERLADFWSKVLDRPVDHTDYPGIATIGADQVPFYVFQALPSLPSGINRAHVDFSTTDLEAETARLVGLGAAVVAEVAENDIRFTTFTDPDGNKFDVVEGAAG